MRMYDAYEKRVMQIAKVKNFVVRFRAVFITFLALIVVLLSGFWSTKGIVLDKGSLPTEIVYGETFAPTESKALFSSTHYEYSLEGSDEWTTEIPSTPGKYVMRTVTEKSFNRTGYSNYVNFEIKPKELKINIIDNSVEYGKNPTNFVYSVLDGHRIDASLFTFNFEDYSASSTYVSVNVDSIIVTDDNNEDVTDYYDIIPVRQMIRFVSKNIDVKAIDLIKEYDGEPIDFSSQVDEKCIKSLIDGDNIVIETIIKDENGKVLTSNPVDVGKYTVEITNTKIYKDGVDTTINYGIYTKTSSLEITPRDLVIETPDYTKEYDGEFILHHEGAIAERLVSGHELVFNQVEGKDYQFDDLINVGNTSNDVEYLIIDENKNDVTSNYNIEYSYGLLTINPMNVSLQLESQKMEYYGGYYFYPSFNVELIGEDYVTANPYYIQFNNGEIIEYNVDPINVGNYFILVDSSTIEIHTNNENNYNISIECELNNDVGWEYVGWEYDYLILNNCPQLTITPMDINISFAENNKTEFSFGDELLFNFAHEDLWYLGYEIDLSINVLFEDNEGNIFDTNNIHSGKYKAFIDKTNTFVSEEYANNFNLIISDSTLDVEITFKTVTVSLFDKEDLNTLLIEKTFDGEPYEYPSDRYFSDLVYDNKLSISVYYEDLLGNVVEPINAGAYQVKIDKEKSGLIEGEVSDYHIIYDDTPINLIISPKQVDISFDNVTYEYGDFVYKKYIDFNADGFVGDDTINAAVSYHNSSSTEEFNVGEYNIYLDVENCEFSSEEAKNNYVLRQTTQSYLTIIPRNVELSLLDVEHTYNALAFDGYDGNSYNAEFVGNDRVLVSCEYELNGYKVNPINVGTYDIVLSNVAFIEGLSSNYNITGINATLTIIPRKVVVSALDYVHEYNGKLPEYPTNNYSIDANEEFMLDNSYLEVSVTYNNSPIDAGNYEIYVDTENTIIHSNNPENYELIASEEHAILTITPRVIYVALPDVIEGKEYDGMPYVYNSNKYKTLDEYENAKDMVNNDALEVDVIYFDYMKSQISEAVDANYYYVKISNVKLKDGYGNPDNYDLRIIDSYGVLEIAPKEITISPVDCEKTYDGYSYVYDSSQYNVTPSLVNNDSVLINVYYKNAFGEITYNPTNADAYDIYIDYLSFVEGLYSNYSFSYDTASLIINPKDIVVEAINQYGVFSGEIYEYNGIEYTVSPELVGSDSLIVSVYYENENGKQARSVINAGTYNIYIDVENTMVLGIRSNYNLIASSNPAKLVISPLEVIISTYDQQKEYDGYKFDYPSDMYYTTPNLVGFDELSVSIYYNEENPINAGTYEIYVDLDNTYLTNGIESNYTFIASSNPSYLTITPRILYVKAASHKAHIYDGQGYEFLGSEIETKEKNYSGSKDKEVVPGDELAATFRYFSYELGDYVDEMVDAGTYTVYVDSVYVIKGLESNYELYTSLGSSFVITPRDIYVTPYDLEDIIYGEKFEYPLGINNYSNTDSIDLVSGEQLEIAVYYENDYSEIIPKDAGQYFVHVDSSRSRIYKNGIYTDTNNYNIIQSNVVEIEILPREVVVNTIDMEPVIYTGLIQSYYPTSQFDGINYEIAPNSLGLVYDDVLQIRVMLTDKDDENNSKYNQTEAGTYYLDIYSFNLSVGNIDNYIFSQAERKTFDILPREINIKPVDLVSETYSGYDIVYPVDQFTITSLYEEYYVRPNAEINVKFVDIETGDEYFDSVREAGSYRVEIVYDNIDRNNFIVTYSNSYFDIYQYYVDVQLNDTYVKTYDEQGLDESLFVFELIDDDYFVINVEYVSIDGLTKYPYSPVEAGEYQIVINENNPYTLFADDPKNYYVDKELILSLSSSLIIDKRNIMISTNSKVVTYDGNPVFEEGFTIQTSPFLLIQSHKVSVDQNSIPTITDVGIINNSLSFIIKNEADEDVTHNYDITVFEGSIEVLPKVLDIVTHSAQKVYDGEELFCDEFDLLTDIGSHSIVCSSYSTLIDASFTSNYLDFIVYDSLGNIVTHNYEFNVEYGTLMINRRTIYVGLLDTEDVTYDGEFHYYDYDGVVGNFVYTNESINNKDYQLVDGEEMILGVSYEKIDVDHFNVINPCDAGQYIIYVDQNATFIGKNNDGINYNFNYNIICHEGRQFNINKKVVEISLLGDESKDYDGYSYSFNNTEDFILSSNYVPGEFVYHVEVDMIDSNGDIVKSFKNVGEYKISINKEKSYMIIGNPNNYEIILSEDEITYTIYPKEIDIYVSENYDTFDKEYYDGNIKFTSRNSKNQYDIGFERGDENSVQFIYIFEDENGICNPLDAGTYTVYVDQSNIMVLDEITYNNYIINNFYQGTLIINPYTLMVKPLLEETSKTYDGQYFYYPTGTDNYVAAGRLLEGDELSIDVRFEGTIQSQIKVGNSTTIDQDYYDYNNKFISSVNGVIDASTYTLYVDSWYINGEESSNYVVSFDRKYTYTIKPREIEISNGSLETEYNGNLIYAPQEFGLESILDQEDRDFVESLGAIISRNIRAEKYGEINAGVYDNKQSVSILIPETETYINHNFLIVLNRGKLVINPKKLYITTSIDNPYKVYDGEAFEITEDMYTIEGLLDNHSIKGKPRWDTIKNAGVYSNYSCKLTVVDETGESSKDRQQYIDNYEIVYNLTTITIDRKEISFGLRQNIVQEFKGDYYTFTQSYIEYYSDSKKPSFSITDYVVIDENGDVIDKKQMIEAGVYTIIVNVGDIKIDNVKNNTNYIILSDSELVTTFTITPYDLYNHGITIGTNSANKVFDNTKLTNEYGWYCNSWPFSKNGINLKVDESYIPFAINPGDNVINDLRFMVVDANGKDISSSFILDNPKIYNYGTLSIENSAEVWLGGFTYNGEEPYISSEYIYNNLRFDISIVDRVDTSYNHLTDYSEVGEYIYLFKINKMYINDEVLPVDIANMLEIRNKIYGYDYGNVFENIYEANLSIYPIEIVLSPMEYSELFEGQNVVLPEEYYNILNDIYPLENHKITIETTGEIGMVYKKGKPSFVATVMNTISKVNVVDVDTGDDVSHRYRFIYTYEQCKSSIYAGQFNKGDFTSKLSYEKRSVEVDCDGNTDNPYVYDGETYKISSYKYLSYSEITQNIAEEKYGLLPGHYLSAKSSVIGGKNVGEVLNKIYFNVFDENGFNVSGAYSIYHTDAPDNYLVTLAREITITTLSRTEKFDEQILTCEEYVLSSGSLVDGHVIEVVFDEGLGYVGTKDNSVKSITIYNSRGTDVTDQYNIELVLGKLTLYY